jgi:DNA-directed RNA polymerase specialized sigma24 family protein
MSSRGTAIQQGRTLQLRQVEIRLANWRVQDHAVNVVGSIDATELGQLEPFRRELTAYCYRMLASAQGAEDAVQDAFVRAWRNLAGFDDRVGVRPWLYRIATNVCLDMLKARRRRALAVRVAFPSSRGPPVHHGADSWRALRERAGDRSRAKL